MSIVIREVVTKVAAGSISVEEAIEYLINEMGRGSIVLAVDDNIKDLAKELSKLRYTIRPVLKDEDDDGIKKILPGTVFITGNGKHFVKDREKFHYGLIWVLKQQYDAPTLAKRIEQEILMKADFHGNLTQLVKIGQEVTFER